MARASKQHYSSNLIAAIVGLTIQTTIGVRFLQSLARQECAKNGCAIEVWSLHRKHKDFLLAEAKNVEDDERLHEHITTWRHRWWRWHSTVASLCFSNARSYWTASAVKINKSAQWLRVASLLLNKRDGSWVQKKGRPLTHTLSGSSALLFCPVDV